MLTGSGQAANFFAMFNIASCGDHIVSSSAIYGGSFNLLAVTMKRMAKTEWKNKLKGLAQRLYPREKVTLNTADAILLAHYGKSIGL